MFDDHNAILVITAGAGGANAHRWVESMARMYRGWAEKNGYVAETLYSEESGAIGCLQEVIAISGNLNTYGLLRSECGIHRFVENVLQRNYTSTVHVHVYPDNVSGVIIRDEDLVVESYTTTGHINNGVYQPTAVRLTHIPSQVILHCDTYRTFGKNVECTKRMLRAYLAVLDHNDNCHHVDESTPIRTYSLLQDNDMRYVEDHRTRYKMHDINAVLYGDKLDGFMVAYWKLNHYADKREDTNMMIIENKNGMLKLIPLTGEPIYIRERSIDVVRHATYDRVECTAVHMASGETWYVQNSPESIVNSMGHVRDDK